MASKQKAWCKITNYIEDTDSDLHELIRATCVGVALESLKGKNGITFLVPQDKAVRDKLRKLAMSENVEDVIKASDMLSACIIRDVFKRPDDWKSAAKDTANSLWPSQVTEVESVNASGVSFKSGAKAVPDPAFKDSSRRQNLAVWKLTGELPVTTDKPAMMKKKSKVGAYELTSAVDSQTRRFKIAIAVENAFDQHLLRRSMGMPAGFYPFIEHALSLCKFALNNHRAVFFDKIAPLITFDCLDFYLLVEPHRSSGEYLLDDAMINEWWASRGEAPMSSAMCHAAMDEFRLALDQSGLTAAVYTKRPQVVKAVTALRSKCIGQLGSGGWKNTISASIDPAYALLEQNNQIGDTADIYPAGLHNYYKNNPGLRKLHDELRYMTFIEFRRNIHDSHDINSLVNRIGDALHQDTQAGRAACSTFLNANIVKSAIQGNEAQSSIKAFVNSTIFMYIPLTKAESIAIGEKYVVSLRDNSGKLLNTHQHIAAEHSRIISIADVHSHDDIIKALRSLDVSKLDPVLKAEFASKFA